MPAQIAQTPFLTLKQVFLGFSGPLCLVDQALGIDGCRDLHGVVKKAEHITVGAFGRWFYCNQLRIRSLQAFAKLRDAPGKAGELALRGSSFKKASNNAASNFMPGGNCQSTAPSLSPSANRPEAMKLAIGNRRAS